MTVQQAVPRVEDEDEDEAIARMVEQASIPSLATLFRKAKEANLIQEEQHYH